MFTTATFDYELPPELIAQTPPPVRGTSRLLVLRGATILDRGFGDLPSLIPPGDLLVLNTTKVRHARLLGRRPTGGAAEVLVIHPAADGTWIAMGKPGSALKPGGRIVLGPGSEIETVEALEGPNRRIRFVGLGAEEAMARFGRLPLPPYIERDPVTADEDRYQTVYAETEGSVAAPTAGLHFTPSMLAGLGAAGVEIGRLDLEVGPGTFRPVEAEDPRAHPMHRESFLIPPRLADQFAATRARGGRVWACGTTVVRALESAAEPGDGEMARALRPGRQETSLLILPGYRFRAVDRLITNFHLPRSTLLMLVCAFGGTEPVLAAYRHAVGDRYRFFSYGDAMAVIPEGR